MLDKPNKDLALQTSLSMGYLMQHFLFDEFDVEISQATISGLLDVGGLKRRGVSFLHLRNRIQANMTAFLGQTPSCVAAQPVLS